MDRLATGAMIAIAALAMYGGNPGDEAFAGEPAPRPPASATSVSSPIYVSGPRSGRVMSLLLTLEAPRTAPSEAPR